MRKLTLLNVVLVSALVLFSVAQAQRINPGDGGGNSGNNPVPVSVANFPSTQTVTGSVIVPNFPKVVTVTGTVDVGNLPLDADGNLRVSGAIGGGSGPAFHFVGITTATVEKQPGFDPEYPILAMNRACSLEIAATRSCLIAEILGAVPPPPAWDGCVLLATGFEDTNDVGICFDSDGNGSFAGNPAPVACCGA